MRAEMADYSDYSRRIIVMETRLFTGNKSIWLILIEKIGDCSVPAAL